MAAILYALDQCSGSAAVIGVEDDPDRRAIVGAPLQLVRQDHHAVILVPASTSL
ncbi:MAG: hypothetical protein M0Z46_06835 [Actinomycetota bacterium]|nr:hypothetical protein [Actinomycetota bacterium]